MRESRVNGWGLHRHFIETAWIPLQHLLRSSSAVAIFFFLALCAGVLVAVRFLDESTVLSWSLSGKFLQRPTQDVYETKKEIDPLNCSFVNLTRSCPAASYYGPSLYDDEEAAAVPSPKTCPDYFRWMYEDLWVWRKTGISREMVMSAQRTAHFRLVIVNGTAYVEKYRKAFQTRDSFSLWGILQLLRRYPGKVPDLELMFDCEDRPVIKARHFQGTTGAPPPPLFKYCASDETLDISFPDWSFWGWPEMNIKPWEGLLKDLKQGSEKIKWIDREAYAYWKGNPSVAIRKNLLTCNVSESQDWGARLYTQNWIEEEKQGFKQSNLASQCTHKYKIYIEGRGWSVSEKYILACDSLTLLVKPRYYDFFSRGLVPLKHYWPIKTKDDKCRSIKHAVDWGNTHPQKAQQFGKEGSKFIEEELKMEFVYDYMFHLLTHYAKLLNYQPTVPPQALQLCSELMLCPATGLEKQFMMDSMVKTPSRTPPCTMPPPFDPATLHFLLRTKQNSINQVHSWENHYWNNHQNSATPI